jgi:lipopolysaccharide export system permease protein
VKKAVDRVFIRYVGRQFLVRFAGLLLFFVIVLQMLDLLNRSEHVLAPDGAGMASILEYIRLRAPSIASQFAPFAALLAVVITLSSLSYSNEVTIMRAAGLSIHRVLFPIGVMCAFIAAGHFIFHETLVVRAAERLAYWEANDYAVGLPPEADTRANIRLNHDGQFIRAGGARRETGGVYLNDVTINEISKDGLVTSEIAAGAARFADGQWRLFDVRAYGVDDLDVKRMASATWSTTLNPEILFALTLNPDRTSLFELVRKIGQLRADGASTRAATTSFLSRFSKPAATLVMPLLGAFAGFGIRRQRNQLQRAVAGAALGFSYFVFENMMLALGKLGVAPAMLGAFFPFAIFMVVGFTILLAMEN